MRLTRGIALVGMMLVSLAFGPLQLVNSQLEDIIDPSSETANDSESWSSTPVTPTSTSTSPTTSSGGKPDYVGEILKKNETNVKKIFELLRKVQAEHCEYGPDPLLNDLCPDLMNVPSYSSIPKLKLLKLSDVNSRIIDDRIVADLIDKCYIGEWCLGDDVLSVRHHNEPPAAPRAQNLTLAAATAASAAAANSSLAFLHDPKLFCLIESCFDNIKLYSDNCVRNNLTNHLVQLAPQFCNFEITNTQSEFCVENSMRLIHVAAAFYNLTEEVKRPTPDVCHDEIVTNKCSVECKRIASSIDKLMSCCADAKLIRNFKSFDWYFGNYDKARRNCDLPIKSICLAEGKYYLGISPKILVLSIVCSVLSTMLITMIVFLVCCRQRRRTGIKNNKDYDMTHYYEYAYLNPGREDEILMGASGVNDEFELNEADDESRRLTTTTSLSNVLLDDNKVVYVDVNNNGNNNNNSIGAGNNRDISRFVDKHQTDIRGLFS